jgi:glycerol-3-phosphate dehydrogenase
MPIAMGVKAVLDGEISPQDAAHGLMVRQLRNENE